MAFVFAGIGVLIALQWSQMNSAARVAVTLGSGLIAFVLAMLAKRDDRFDKGRRQRVQARSELF